MDKFDELVQKYVAAMLSNSEYIHLHNVNIVESAISLATLTIKMCNEQRVL